MFMYYYVCEKCQGEQWNTRICSQKTIGCQKEQLILYKYDQNFDGGSLFCLPSTFSGQAVLKNGNYSSFDGKCGRKPDIILKRYLSWKVE